MLQGKTWCYVDRLVLRPVVFSNLVRQKRKQFFLVNWITKELHPIRWELGATSNFTAYALSSLFACRFFQTITYIGYPRQRQLFYYSECRYEEWRHSLRSHQMWSPQSQEDNGQWQHRQRSCSRIALEAQIVAAGRCTSEARTCCLGDEDFQIRTMTEGMTELHDKRIPQGQHRGSALRYTVEQKGRRCSAMPWLSSTALIWCAGVVCCKGGSCFSWWDCLLRSFCL